uniref:Uncharacterized protein n=1 Tax=Candidatus Kentrum sp. MB TaxID=2138164 RepID=A0A451B733_9GAMM|nr:MAG: hypothetical protein BECKMB1821H_GA0114242_100133 [Candidatus Kentron sp. MB]
MVAVIEDVLRICRRFAPGLERDEFRFHIFYPQKENTK